MPFNHFDRIRIVNLPHRKDRLLEMRDQLAKVGLLDDPRVEFFEALSPQDRGLFTCKGSNGCFQSHFTILEEAAEAGQSVLILEDDCDFVLPQAAEFALPDDCDVFYGGYVASDPANPHESDIIGSHFMGFSKRAAKLAVEYLSGFVQPEFKADPRAVAEQGYDPAVRPGIDGAYVWFRRAHPEIVTVFSHLGVQRQSRTDIGDQRWFDRTPGVAELAGLARRFLRCFRSGNVQKGAMFR